MSGRRLPSDVHASTSLHDDALIGAPTLSTTYRRADGEDVLGEYGWVADLDVAIDEADAYADAPVAYVEETWERVDVRVVWVLPPVYDCRVDGECEEDAVAWARGPEGGAWTAVCADHAEAARLAGGTVADR